MNEAAQGVRSCKEEKEEEASHEIIENGKKLTVES